MTVAAWEEWTFTSSLTRPDGVKFEVVCTVSPEQYGDDFPELSEVTQMAIARIASDLRANERAKIGSMSLADLMLRPRGPIASARPPADTAGEKDTPPTEGARA